MPGPTSANEAVPFFFAFPDGVMDYACAECSALCCSTQGIGGGLDTGMLQVLSQYPPLAILATEREIDQVGFNTPTGPCFFLGEDNLCRIEKEHGKTTKPDVCVLFPFNAFTRLGSVVVVSPHLLKCQFRLQIPARPGIVEGTHASIEETLRKWGALDPAYVKNFLQNLLVHPDLTARTVLKREIGFRDACSQAIGRIPFADVVRGASTEPAALDLAVERAIQILGLEEQECSPSPDSTDDLLLTLASQFRLTFLTLSSEGVLRALALAERVLRFVSQLLPAPPAPLETDEIIRALVPMLRLLARADEPLEIHRSAKLKSQAYGVPELVFTHHRFWRGFSNTPQTLKVLEQVVPTSLPLHDRTVLFQALGNQMDRVLLRGKRRIRPNTIR